jgi:hypothetical protein
MLMFNKIKTTSGKNLPARAIVDENGLQYNK